MKDHIYFFLDSHKENDKYRKTFNKRSSKPELQKILDIECCLPSLETYSIAHRLESKINLKNYQQVFARVKLGDVRKGKNNKHKRIIYLQKKALSNYLIPRRIYEQFLGIDFSHYIGRKVGMISDARRKVKIEEFNDYQPDIFKNSLYKSLVVSRNEGTRVIQYRISPWELKFDFIQKISTYNFPPEEDEQKILNILEDRDADLGLSNINEVFVEKVSQNFFPDYLNKVPNMMYIEKIRLRVKNQYYRSEAQF